MSEGRRIGAGWIAVGVLILATCALSLLAWRHKRLMRGRESALTEIVSDVGIDFFSQDGYETAHVAFFGETRHEWSITKSLGNFNWIRVICAHSPYSFDPPRILIVDEGGAPEGARQIERIEAKLRDRGWSYSVIHAREINGTGGENGTPH